MPSIDEKWVFTLSISQINDGFCFMAKPFVLSGYCSLVLLLKKWSKTSIYYYKRKSFDYKMDSSEKKNIGACVNEVLYLTEL